MRESGNTGAACSLSTLQIGNDWPTQRVGGLNRYFSELLLHLPETNTEVRGLVVGPPSIQVESKGLVSPFAAASDPIFQRVWRARRAINAELAKGDIDLLVSHFALYTCSLVSPGIPLVVHFHGPWAAEGNVEVSAAQTLKVKSFVETSVYSRARRLIVLSRAFQRELVARYGVKEELIRVVPGGVDLRRFGDLLSKAEAREKLGWSQDRPLLLAVRRMVRRMGLETLIDAFAQIIKEHPDAVLLLGGRGPIESELQKRASDYGLKDNVRFLGRIAEEDLALAYRAADLTIVPSQSFEGFGMITLESLACGTPALVTPVGGLPEIIMPFAPQCVFADTSTKAIVDTVGDVLRGECSLPEAQACRDYASTFSWSRIARQVRSVYDEAYV